MTERTSTQILAEALTTRGFRLYDRLPQPADSHLKEFRTYGQGGHLVVMMVYRRQEGCELFIPLCTSNSIQETITALDAMLKDMPR